MKKKILTIVTLLVLALIVGALNIPVMADEIAGATVTDATAADTKLGEGEIKSESPVYTINGTEQTIELVYNVAALKIVTGEDVEDRPEGYAWIGVKVTRPNGATSGVEDDGTPYAESSFYQYFGVDLAKLQEAVENGTGYISYTKSYDWKYDGSGVTDKVTKTTLTVKIKAEGVTLAGGDDEAETLWDQNKYSTYKLEVALEELRAELENQGLAQAEIEERLEIAEGLLEEQDLTIEQLKAKLAELTKTVEAAKEDNKPTTAETQEKDNTPKTGVVDFAVVSSVVAMISLAGIVTVKKYNK